MGGGSNLLASDAGHPGTVIHMATRGVTARRPGYGQVDVTAQAGEPLLNLLAYAIGEGLSGIEYRGGIPGCLTAITVWDWW